MAEHLATGQQAEDTAAHYLTQQGMALLQRNYHCPCGEIDLVMQEGKTVVFVEVRFRRPGRFGSAVETVDRRKQQKLLAAAAHFLQRNPRFANKPCRFDVIGLSTHTADINWIRDAFQT